MRSTRQLIVHRVISRTERSLRQGALAAMMMAISPTSWAQVFGEEGLVEILPAGAVAGDGSTPVTVHVLALNPDGSPMDDLKLRTSVSSGTTDGWESIGAGLYAFEFVPPVVGERTMVTLNVKGKSSGRIAIDSDLSVPVMAPGPSRIDAVANPPEIILGQTSEATLSFTLQGPSGQTFEGVELLASSSSGEITSLTHMGEGKFSARFLAPKVNYPHLSIITIADARNPADVYGYTVVPLMGQVDYPVQASPNATVLLRVGEREFGPVEASPQGRAAVPIVVSPGVSEATLVSVAAGKSTEEAIDLRVPETRRIHMVPGLSMIPSDDRLAVPLRTIVLDAKGAPDTSARVTITTTSGQMEPARHVRDGVYEAIFQPPAGRTQMAATIQAVLQGSSIQSDSAEVMLMPSLPGSLSLSSEPSELATGATGLKVFGQVKSVDGSGLAERSLTITAAGAQLKGAVQDLKGGDYRADFSADENTGVDVYGLVRGAASDNPLHGLVVLPGRESINHDGATSVLLHVLSVDQFGYPVPNVPVTLSLDSGDGALPTAVTTDAHGVGQMFYTAGREAGLVRVSATAANAHGTAAFLQATGVNVDLPVSGTDQVRSVVTAWEANQSSLQIGREGSMAGAVATVVDGSDVGALAAFKVDVEPSMIASGGEVTLKIQATDASGAGLAGQRFDLLSSAGSFGIVSDMGGGAYQTTFSVPAGASGAAKVSVMSDDGGVISVVSIPVTESGAVEEPTQTWGGTAATPQWGASGEPDAGAAPAAPAASETTASATEATKPKPKPKPKKEKTARSTSSTDRPWLRARISGIMSSYVYEQSPTTSPGPLLSEPLLVGGEGGGAAAMPFGFEANVMGWLESLPYVGFNTTFRWSRYSLASSAFSDDVSDSLYNVEVDVTGRYPFEVGSDQFHVGGRLGYKYDDFVVFRGCLDPGCTVEYEPLGVSAFVFGAEVGADIERAYIVAALTGGLGNFTEYYSTAVDTNVGYNVHSNVFVDVGFTAIFRNVDLEGADSQMLRGSVKDSQIMGKVGVGVSF
jgi:hypothetical protein